MSNTLEKQLEATLVKIYVSGKFEGTGFFITPKGHILTAYHVLDDYAGKDIDVVSEKHGKFTKVPIFNKECRGHDLIVLKINFDKEQIKLDCVPLSQQLPEDRAEVLGAGFPLANEDPERMKAAIYDGRFIRSYSDSKTFEVDHAIQGKGQSGGLIYDVKNRRVIGVVRQVHKDELMKDTGLATRLDGLFETWEELAELTKQVAQHWDQQFPRETNNSCATEPSDIDIKRLPAPLTELIGREQELEQIQQAFESPQTFLAIIVAAGGIGKSALSDAWLKSIQPHYQGVQRVFAWSFYSQGAHDTQTSAAPFFQVALPFFGWTGELPKDDIAQGRALAKLLLQQSFILILDGLEPLQHPAHILDGELKDTATGLHTLFSAIRREGLAHSPSLILISSRQPLQELEAWETKKYVTRDLQTLPNHDGAKLLKKLEVRGTEAELQQATQEMGGHALAVVLLGKLLKAKFAGRVERRDQLPPLWEEHKQGAHAQRVLQFYIERYWLENTPELAFLQLLGLFDRPMGLGEKEVLVANAECAAPLRDLDDVGWEMLETRLKDAGILLFSDGFQWDCHPLIRDYFAKQFQTTHPDQFRQTHLILFEYYQRGKRQPDTLAELEPLYRAVAHGCLAGEYQKALDAVYWERILRGKKYYSLYELGAHSQDLTALAAFFPKESECSQSVQQRLSESNQAWLLAEKSYRLMCLGRLTESIKSRQTALRIRVKIEDWKNASVTSRNLVDSLLPLGKLREAAEAASQSIDYIYKIQFNQVRNQSIEPSPQTKNQSVEPNDQDNGYLFEQVKNHATLATILHRQGLDAAEEFANAEQLQQQYSPNSPMLYSVWGFQYCAWLLDQPNADLSQVVARGEYGLGIKTIAPLLDFALNSLTLARAYNQLGDIDRATTYFEQAVSGIRKAGMIDRTPPFLIDRANFYLQQQQLEQAQQDLDEAWQIIERGGMKLYAVDYHLAMCRYAQLQQQPSEAAAHLEKAKVLIKTTGYHLRDKDVKALSEP